MRILNLAAGKFDPLEIEGDNMLYPRYSLNVDTSYFTDRSAHGAEVDIKQWEKNPDRISKSSNLNCDVFEFMERCSIRFDRVAIYRFLEHVSFTQVGYFIYLVSTVLDPGGIVDVIVPNYRTLAEMIICEENMFNNCTAKEVEARNVLLTTELLNEPSCPHASIWTDERMKYFWELEGRFKVLSHNRAFKFDGRDIYLRSIIERTTG